MSCNPGFRPEARRAAAVRQHHDGPRSNHPYTVEGITMGLSLTQAAPAAHPITADDRMERIGQLTTRQLTDALLFLAGYAPAVFDAVAEAVEPCAGDGTEDPAPFCAICGGDLGVFLKLGLDWRHYTGT